jgi:acyl carrier protein
MNEDEAYTALEDSLAQVAPEVDLGDVDHDADLVEELELDSMDLLALVTELHERTGVSIPESDTPRLTSVRAVVAYLVAASA